MNYEQLKRGVSISKHALDSEIEKQAAYLLECVDSVAESISARDSAKEALTRIDAEIASELRAHEEKISESKIISLLPLDERHILAAKNLSAAKLEADRWVGLQEVYRQRGSMLKVLVDLYLSGYYARDSASGSEDRAQSIRSASGRAEMAATRKPIVRRG